MQGRFGLRVIGSVPLSTNHIGHEVDEAQYGEKGVEAIEPAVVDVIGEPALAVVASRDPLHHRNQEAAHEEAERERREEQTRAHCLHSLRGLSYEEVELTRVYERLARPNQKELWDQEEHAYRERRSGC